MVRQLARGKLSASAPALGDHKFYAFDHGRTRDVRVAFVKEWRPCARRLQNIWATKHLISV